MTRTRSGRDPDMVSRTVDLAEEKSYILAILGDKTNEHPANNPSNPLHAHALHRKRQAYQAIEAEDPTWWEREHVAGNSPESRLIRVEDRDGRVHFTRVSHEGEDED